MTLSASTVEEAAQVVAVHQNPTHLTLNVHDLEPYISHQLQHRRTQYNRFFSFVVHQHDFPRGHFLVKQKNKNRSKAVVVCTLMTKRQPFELLDWWKNVEVEEIK